MAAQRIAYLDCFSGISGDMFLSALLHLGLDEKHLRTGLDRLNLGDVRLKITRITRCGISAQKLTVKDHSKKQFRTLPVILEVLQGSGLDQWVVDKAADVFRTLAEAEAKVHDTAINQVHFHEVGAVDTLIDVVGVLIGLRYFNIERLVCSPLPLGSGTVDCEHGRLPLPAPAVCELLQGVPTYGIEAVREMITPTGAALVKVIAERFGSMEKMVISGTGYGSGSREMTGKLPNLCRIIIGESYQASEVDQVEVIETNLDDWNPETFPHLCELLMEQGALDVSLSPLVMKKGRPGQLLRIICDLNRGHRLKKIVLSETSAIGLRFHQASRLTLARREVTLDTRWGPLQAKEVQTPTGTVIYPEYEACRKLALEKDLSLDAVYREVYAVSTNKE